MNKLILTPKQISILLQDRKARVISKMSGISQPTINSLKGNKDKRYTAQTIEKLSDYLISSSIIVNCQCKKL